MRSSGGQNRTGKAAHLAVVPWGSQDPPVGGKPVDGTQVPGPAVGRPARLRITVSPWPVLDGWAGLPVKASLLLDVIHVTTAELGTACDAIGSAADLPGHLG